MRILALEPYYGGSHRAFLDGLVSHSRHEWTTLTLPPYKWKWRMRHAAITFAEQANQLVREGREFDLLFATDMLNLAEFRGLVDQSLGSLPAVVYFHENQLTYPVREEQERDYHFAFSNFSTCLAADQIWFNSDYHMNDLLSALDSFLNRMPDYQSTELIPSVRKRSRVVYPGLDSITAGPTGESHEPPHILWSARWEHDKNPELFFAALEKLREQGLPFRLSVIGESFDEIPPIFARARATFADQIVQWGYLPNREDYLASLQSADIFVSTANHEFYGIAALEAISAGAYPLLPDRLSYPELLKQIAGDSCSQFLYDGSLDSLVARLSELLNKSSRHLYGSSEKEKRSSWSKQLRWTSQIEAIDNSLEQISLGD